MWECSSSLDFVGDILVSISQSPSSMPLGGLAFLKKRKRKKKPIWDPIKVYIKNFARAGDKYKGKKYV